MKVKVERAIIEHAASLPVVSPEVRSIPAIDIEQVIEYFLGPVSVRVRVATLSLSIVIVWASESQAIFVEVTVKKPSTLTCVPLENMGPDVIEVWPSGMVIVKGLPVKDPDTAVTSHVLESAPVVDKSYVEESVQVSLYGCNKH